MNDKNIMLTISLLASDRPDTMRKCLESLEPIRKAVSCQVIVTDTGCSKPVRAVIDELADEVTEFTWVKDFAKARNVGLSMAKGQWFMFIDDDEWFVDTKDIIDFFNKGYYKRFDHAYYVVRNFTDLEGKQYNDFHAMRILKIEDGLHFEGRIHEYLVPAKKEGLALNSLAYHYGYAFATEEERIAHYQRNVHALEEMVELEPDVLRWWTHLAKEYLTGHEYKKLYDLCDKGLEKVAGLKVLGEDDLALDEARNRSRAITSFYAGKILVLQSDESVLENSNTETEEAGDEKKLALILEACEKALNVDGANKMLEAFAYTAMADTYLKQGALKEALDCCSKYFLIRKYYKDHDSEFVVDRTIAFAGNSLSDDYIKMMYSIEMIAGMGLGDTKPLVSKISKLEWSENKAFLYSMQLISGIAQTLENTKSATEFLDLVKECRKNAEIWHYILNAITVCQLPKAKIEDNLKALLKKAGCYEEVDAYVNWRKSEHVLIDIGQFTDLKAILECMKLCAKGCIDFYNVTKGEDYLKNDIPNLPRPALDGLLMNEVAIGYEKGDMAAVKTSLTQLASIDSDFRNIVNKAIVMIDDMERSTKQNAMNELLVLKENLIREACSLAKNGNKAEAKSIIVQLQNVFGDDPEVELASVRVNLS